MLASGIVTLRGKCPYSYSGPYFPAFGLNTERYGEISPYLVQMRENTDQNNSEYWHFLRIFSRDIYFRFKTILELILYCFLIPIDSHEHLYFEFSCVFPLKIYSIFFLFIADPYYCYYPYTNAELINGKCVIAYREIILHYLRLWNAGKLEPQPYNGDVYKVTNNLTFVKNYDCGVSDTKELKKKCKVSLI